MKKIIYFLFAFTILFTAFTGCDKEETEKAPVLPPYESMVIDFSSFSGDSKSISDIKTTSNFFWAATTVYIWNATLVSVLSVPVAAFYSSFNHTPVYLGNKKWQWTYTVNGFAGEYTARLTGEVLSDDVKWEMYISKTGIGAYDEFKWFEGTSSADRNTGQWTLYHSYQYQEEVLVIDWLRISGELSQITYTYVRELNNDRVTDNFNGSFLTYGLQEGNYNAYYHTHAYVNSISEFADTYYHTHAYVNSISEFADTYIEWNTTEYYGHIKASYIYQDDIWHCWDNLGNDIDCTN